MTQHPSLADEPEDPRIVAFRRYLSAIDLADYRLAAAARRELFKLGLMVMARPWRPEGGAA